MRRSFFIFMPATFNWAQSFGTAGAQTRSELASSGNISNFKTNDDATPANYSSNPITASDASNGGNSKEVFLQGHWTGTFTTVSNLKFHQSAAFSPSTGLQIKYACTPTYTTPTTNDSAISSGETNTANIPTSAPGSANIGIADNLAGSLSAAGYSDYIVLQLHVGSTAAAGDTSLATLTLSYDET